MAQREICNSQEPNAINYSNSQPIPDYMSNYPYHIYPPFWNFPVYNFPPFQLHKYPSFGCKYCRGVSYRSVMTQTSLNEEDEHVVVSSQGNRSLEEALPVENQLQNFEIKSEQNIDGTVNFKEISNQNQAKIQPQQIENQNEILSEAALQSRKSLSKDSIFQKMLSQYLINQTEYEKLIFDYMNNNTLMSQLVKYFNEKLCTFKKSKQEMIKLIIRKTQRHYKMENNCKKDERFKKFGGFKSMNSIYLQKLFSDPAFTRAYLDIMTTFIEEFKNDNFEKLTVFCEKVYSAENFTDFKCAMKSLDQKNKMPWPFFWIEKLRKVTMQLMTNFVKQEKIGVKNKGRKLNNE